MTVEKIKEILKQKDVHLESIHHKINMLQKEWSNLEKGNEILNAAALPAGHGIKKQYDFYCMMDNGEILLKYYWEINQRKEEIKAQINKLMEEESKIGRVWCCFQILQEPYYGIIYNLYIEKILYRTVEANYQFSHRVFEERRKMGLQMILQMYESKSTNMELIQGMSF